VENKKILIVTRNFPPLIGGMEKLNFNIFQSIKKNFNIIFAGPVGSSSFHGLEKYVEFSVRPLWKYIIHSLLKTLLIAIKEKPDIVFCGSGTSILAGYFSARVAKASLVCYLHGLDIVADSKIYRWFFLPLIKKSDLIFVNSNHTYKLAITAGIDSSCIRILYPGTELPDISNKVIASQRFRLRYDIGESPFILIAGRITARKGITEFITNVMPGIVETHPELQLIIIGDEARDAVKQSLGVKDNIVAAINKLDLSNNVKLLGLVDNAILSGAFFAAEMLIFPVLNVVNDVEGFGMVAIEAAAHGLPTVAFNVGGISDAISNNYSGWLVESGNYYQMSHIILEAYSPSYSGPVTLKSCVEFSKQFSWDFFGTKLNDYIKNLQEK